MTETGLWCGMFPSTPVVLWSPDGQLFYHDTYTEAAAHIYHLLEGDRFCREDVGEIAFILTFDKQIDTSAGVWSIVADGLT